ncbi:uncharacterized protein LOC132798871 [Drosophila nasuta]|uniref:uncharacterized protein LOC132798871 n=1 Tax=Drosophila nasuta TaxID=42062 RepID=UPI00295E8E6E|nr:uncharacterized protein LOC132798871 [Drosophila nasuta]
MVDRYYGSYEAISIQSVDTVSQKTISTDSHTPNIHITRNMVHDLHCLRKNKDASTHSIISPLLNAPTPPVSEAGEVEMMSEETVNFEQTEDMMPNCKHQVMIIFEGGDINCALYFLIKSMENPFACNAVATVLVEKSLLNEFVSRVKLGMRPMLLNEPKVSKFRNTLDALEKFNIETIHCKCRYPEMSPVLVFDCQHGELGEGTTGVICVRTFTAISEIIDICMKESLLFATSSMWNESVEQLYQLVVALNCPTFFFNCSDVSLHPIRESLAAKKNSVCISDGFHYETLLIQDEMKSIIFPIGAHLYQSQPEKSVMIAPVSFLNE